MHDAGYCRIPLKRRDGTIVAYALVDHDDAHIAEHSWCLGPGGYAVRSIRLPDRRRRHLLLHRAVVGLEVGDPRNVDHINRDRLDCRRANLRIVPRGANQQNVTPRGRTSSHRGVYWEQRAGRWCARVFHDGRKHFIGYFDDELEAASAAAAYRARHLPHATD